MTFNNHGVRGPDISMYQDSDLTPAQIDFETMRAAGAEFVIIRAGQNTWPDPDFYYNYTEAKKAGLARGLYFYYDSRVSPESQAALFLSLTGWQYPELGIWLDLEENYRGAYQGWANWKKCLDLLRTKAPLVGIYTGPSYWKENRPLGANYLNYFKSFPLWIANYGVVQPEIPAPWVADDCLFWQYGTPSIGTEMGVESLEIDMNLFNGTREQFKSYFHLTDALPLPDNGETTMHRYEALNLRPNMSLRAFHNTEGAFIQSYPVRTIFRGDYVWTAPMDLYINDLQVNKAGDKWLEVKSVNGAAVTQTSWVAITHKGETFCTLAEINPPVEEPGEITLTHTIEVYDDGSIKVDGVSFE